MEPILKEKINDLQQEKRELIKKISELSEKLNQTDSFKAESDRLFNNMRTVERELEKEQKKISQIQEKEHQIQQKSEQAKKEANDNLEKARTHSPECEDKYKTSARPPQTLATMLKEERRKYEEAQNISGLDFSQVRLKYKKTKALYEKAKRYLMEQEEFLIQSEKRIESRKEKLQVIQHSITRRAKISFLTYLKQRNYTGKLRFDHENHVIDIAVKQKADQDFTDVMNLSGGEKSYCLVSLLLALWDVMECPFYCVDEFDVCMDEVNRQAATSMLVKGAEIMENRQFIFITPLSLDHMKNDKHVKIFEVTK